MSPPVDEAASADTVGDGLAEVLKSNKMSTDAMVNSHISMERQYARMTDLMTSNQRSQFPQNITFSGELTADVNLFIQLAQRHIELLNMTDEDVLLVIPDRLNGRANKWYKKSCVAIQSWADLKLELRKEFGATTKRKTILKKIRTRQQAQGESARDYGDAIEELCDLVGQDEDQKLSTFEMGLLPRYHDLMRGKSFDDFKQAIRYVVDCEQSFADRVDPIPVLVSAVERLTDKVATLSESKTADSRVVASVSTDNTAIENLAHQFEKLANQVSAQSHQLAQTQQQYTQISAIQNGQGNNRPPIVCYNCNGNGHMARECPQPRRPRGPAPSNYQGANQRSTGARCTVCNMNNHTTDSCGYFKRGEPCPSCSLCGKKGHSANRCRAPLNSNGLL